MAPLDPIGHLLYKATLSRLGDQLIYLETELGKMKELQNLSKNIFQT